MLFIPTDLQHGARSCHIESAIVDSGATSSYISTDLIGKRQVDTDACASIVTTASGEAITTQGSTHISITNGPKLEAAVMNGLIENIVSVGQLCDQGLTVLYDAKTVTFRQVAPS